MKPLRIPPNRYITLFPGRTGSTWLTSHMISHPEVAARFEILSRCDADWESQRERMDQLYEKLRFPVVKAVGFKTKLHNIADWDAFADYLREKKMQVIHQIRRNHLKLIISVIRAKLLRDAAGQSNLFRDVSQPLGPVEIPLRMFARCKRRLIVAEQLQKFVDRLELETLVISYEDLMTDETAALNRVWDFLQVKRVQTQGNTHKNTPDDIRQVVTNLDEILTHHPDMIPFVDDDRNSS